MQIVQYYLPESFRWVQFSNAPMVQADNVMITVQRIPFSAKTSLSQGFVSRNVLNIPLDEQKKIPLNHRLQSKFGAW